MAREPDPLYGTPPTYRIRHRSFLHGEQHKRGYLAEKRVKLLFWYVWLPVTGADWRRSAEWARSDIEEDLKLVKPFDETRHFDARGRLISGPPIAEAERPAPPRPTKPEKPVWEGSVRT